MESFLRFIYFLIQPDIQLVILLMAGYTFLVLKWYVWAQKSFLLFFVLAAVYTLPWLPEFLTDKLENKHSVISYLKMEEVAAAFRQSQSDSIFVIVLGAGHSTDPRVGPTSRLGESVMMRLAEAVRLYNMLEAKELPVRLVTSANGFEGQMTQAEAVAEAAVIFGVPKSNISHLNTPTNTCEEARAFSEKFGQGQMVFISSAALHQRRAVMLFEKTGSRPVAAPASFINPRSPEAPNRWWRRYRPSIRNLSMLKRSIKEMTGYEVGVRTCQPLLQSENITANP